MNLWLFAAGLLILGLIPCGAVCLRGEAVERLAGLQMATLLTVMALLLLAQGFSRPSFYDLGLTLAVLSFPSGLLFAHFLERWL